MHGKKVPQFKRKMPIRRLLAAGSAVIAVGGGAALGLAEWAGAATVGTFSATGSLTTARADAQSVVLSNGKVLVAGGLTGSGVTAAPTETAELYDPTSGVWSAAASLPTARYDA